MKMFKREYYATHPNKRYELQLLRLAGGPDAEIARIAAESLLADNEGFLKVTLLDWAKNGYQFNFDELLREAMTAFYEAIRCYDTDKDVSIRYYARYHLLKLREQFFCKKPWTEMLPEHDISFTIEPFKKEQDLTLTKSLSEAFEHRLTPVEKEVVYLHYFKNLSKRKIARLRGCSERRIGAVIDNALPKLRVFLLRKGIDLSIFATN
jgi:RNA polymerase sigma factor (sigma-70 family)